MGAGNGNATMNESVKDQSLSICPLEEAGRLAAVDKMRQR